MIFHPTIDKVVSNYELKNNHHSGGEEPVQHKAHSNLADYKLIILSISLLLPITDLIMIIV
jgi:hypothetical protein